MKRPYKPDVCVEFINKIHRGQRPWPLVTGGDKTPRIQVHILKEIREGLLYTQKDMTAFLKTLNEFSVGHGYMKESSVIKAMNALSDVPHELGGNNAVAKAHKAANEFCDKSRPTSSRDVARVVAQWISTFLEAATEEDAGKNLDFFILRNG